VLAVVPFEAPMLGYRGNI